MRLKYLRLFLVLAVTAVLLSCGGAEERKAKYLERGKAYLADKNYDKAIIEFKNVLQIDPKYAEAYYLLGEVQEKKDDIAKAYGNYSKAVELNPDHLKARAKLARIYFSVGQVDKADELITYILKKKPTDPEANILRAYVLAQKGDTAGALKLAKSVISADPKQVDAIVLVATIHRKEGHPDQAQAVLEQGAAANPGDIRILSALAQVYFAEKNLAKTEEILRKIIATKPDVFQHRIGLAMFFAQTKQPDKAEKTLQDAVQAKPTDPERYLALADFLISQHRGEKLEPELLAAIDAHPKEMGLRFALAAYYLKLGKPDDAEKAYNKIIGIDSVGPDGMKARKQLAEVLLRENKYSEASGLIATVIKDNPEDAQALLLRGKIEMSQTNPDPRAATADFRSVLKSQPDSVEVLTLLARAHQMNNEPRLAREALQKAVKVAPKDPGATVRLTRFLMVNDKDTDGALKVLNEFLANSPGDLSVLEAKMAVQAAKKDSAGVAETIATIKKLYPDKSVGYFHSGEFLLSQGKYREALQQFEEARARAKTDFRPIDAIAKIHMKLENRQAAIKTIDDFLGQNPGNLDALQAKANIFAAAHDSTGFFNVVDDIKRTYPDKPYGSYLAGEYLLSQKAYDKAIVELKMATAKAPQSDKIIEELTKAYTGAGQTDTALSWLDGLSKTKPSDAAIPFLTGEVRTVQGKYPEAIAAFNQALKLDPKNKATYDKLAQAYIRQRNFDAAVKIYQQGLAVMPNDDDLRFNLASTYEVAGRYDDAMKIYEALLKKNARNILAANNLASLLTDHKGDKASLERAKILAAPFENSNQPALMDTLGWIYYKLGEIDRALPLLKKASAAAPTAAVLHYHLGMAYYKSGNKAAAKTELTQAFASDPKLAGADEGRAILKGL